MDIKSGRSNSQSEDNITLNEKLNEIHFNASINSKSISTLISKLHHLEETILKRTRKLEFLFKRY